MLTAYKVKVLHHFSNGSRERKENPLSVEVFFLLSNFIFVYKGVFDYLHASVIRKFVEDGVDEIESVPQRRMLSFFKTIPVKTSI